MSQPASRETIDACKRAIMDVLTSGGAQEAAYLGGRTGFGTRVAQAALTLMHRAGMVKRGRIGGIYFYRPRAQPCAFGAAKDCHRFTLERADFAPFVDKPLCDACRRFLTAQLAPPEP